MRRLNLGALLWSIALSLTTGGICYLFLSGKLALFLHPRTWVALGLATGMLLILSMVSWRQLRSPRVYSPVGWAHTLFLLPLLLALTCPPQMLSPEVIGNKGLFGVLRGQAINCSEHHGPLPVLALDQPIIMDEENFLQLLEDLWCNTDAYLGRDLEMLGFVYEDPALGPHDFVVARLVMTCCAADAEVAGLLCRYSERHALTPGQWVTVRGTLAQMPYYHMAEQAVINMPYLQVREISPSEKPAQEYIYP